MSDDETAVADVAMTGASVVLEFGDPQLELVGMLLQRMTEHGCPPVEQVALQAAADQLVAALRQLHASAGVPAVRSADDDVAVRRAETLLGLAASVTRTAGAR